MSLSSRFDFTKLNVFNMFVILIIITITLASALEVRKDDIDAEIKSIIGKYVNKIPDVESQYVVNEGLSRVISQYFKGKISTFPLYKISLKIDRNPVKIPWTIGAPDDTPQNRNITERQYKYVPVMKGTQ